MFHLTKKTSLSCYSYPAAERRNEKIKKYEKLRKEVERSAQTTALIESGKLLPDASPVRISRKDNIQLKLQMSHLMMNRQRRNLDQRIRR